MVHDNIDEFGLEWHRVEDTLPENEPHDSEYPGDIPCVTRAEGSLFGDEPNVEIMKNARRRLSYPEERYVWERCLPGYKIVAWAYPKKVAPVRHGHWIRYTETDIECSECGDFFVTPMGCDPIADCMMCYCSTCGAKMD